MNILIIEPFCCGSHQQWIEGYRRHSAHKVETLTLPDGSWRWRMKYGCVELAQEFLARDLHPDCIIASDLLDLPTFLALTRRKTSSIPVVAYFHENQLSYPWSPHDRHGAANRFHFGFTNVHSALSADQVWFNSEFHRESFLKEADDLIGKNPDRISNPIDSVEHGLSEKCFVFPLGFETEHLLELRNNRQKNTAPVIGWNHRWDRDKNPDQFFAVLEQLQKEGVAFQLMILGEELDTELEVFQRARATFREETIHFGYAKSQEEYLRLLSQVDVLPVTSNQEFFGISVVEATLCGAVPLLPNRLSYPELVPEELHSTFLYQSEDELREKLQRSLRGDSFPNTTPVVDHLRQFDWKSIASLYDRRIRAI